MARICIFTNGDPEDTEIALGDDDDLAMHRGIWHHDLVWPSARESYVLRRHLSRLGEIEPCALIERLSDGCDYVRNVLDNDASLVFHGDIFHTGV